MGLDTHPAGPLAEATAAPSGAAMAKGQWTARRQAHYRRADVAWLGLGALGWLPADIWVVTSARRY
jgi:hypothetical protein